MATGDAANQHPPDARVAPTAPDIGTLQSQAARLAVTQTVAVARGGLRLWRSPLAAAARRSSRSLAANLQPVATRALRRGVDRALASPLPEALAGTLVEHDVPERMAAVLLKGDTLERVLDIAEREQVVKRLLEHSLTERFAAELGAGERLGHLLAALAPGDQARDGAPPEQSDEHGPSKVLGALARAILPGSDHPAPPPEPTDAEAPPPASAR